MKKLFPLITAVTVCLMLMVFLPQSAYCQEEEKSVTTTEEQSEEETVNYLPSNSKELPTPAVDVPYEFKSMW